MSTVVHETQKGAENLPRLAPQKAWTTFRRAVRDAIVELCLHAPSSYRGLDEPVRELVRKATPNIPMPVCFDDQAQELILGLTSLLDGSPLPKDGPDSDSLNRVVRHTQGALARHLLDLHLGFLREILDSGSAGVQRLMASLPRVVEMPVIRQPEQALRRIEVYFEVGAFLHLPELHLSVAKVRSRAASRARRGNLWPVDRESKFSYLEELIDDGAMDPCSEDDLVFLVSQSSLEMLRKKVVLLQGAAEAVTANRLKANFSRLQDHVERIQKRDADLRQRQELLREMGASPEQVEYISARASYQTMSNLLRLADGDLAISDLMGGKRTIKKILRRQGRQAEDSGKILKYLVSLIGVDQEVAVQFLQNHPDMTREEVVELVEFLEGRYARHYRSHWGFHLRPRLLRKTVQIGLSRSKLRREAMTARDFLHDLRQAVMEEEQTVIGRFREMDVDKRRMALEPLREVLDYETDSETKKQLVFIYEQFCNIGLCIPREKLKQICLNKKEIFPNPRKVQDALEILNGSYRAIGQHGDALCVSPDYLAIQS